MGLGFVYLVKMNDCKLCSFIGEVPRRNKCFHLGLDLKLQEQIVTRSQVGPVFDLKY